MLPTISQDSARRGGCQEGAKENRQAPVRPEVATAISAAVSGATAAATGISAPPGSPGISSPLSETPPNATAVDTVPFLADASGAASRDTSRRPPRIPARPHHPAAG